MDNVLFYGERDEATRRQVRSAAAAHSHRIGPRKPKAALKQPKDTASTTTTKRRSAQQQKPRSDLSSPPATSIPQDAKVQDPHRASASVGASAGVLRPQQAIANNRHVQPAGMAGLNLHSHAQSPPRSSPDQPYVSGVVSPSSRPTSSPDLSQRLPQYSWTEYPRYALSSNHMQSLDMLADAASTAREAGSRSPAESSLPDLRHFEKSAEGRPILPPLVGIQQHPSVGGAEGGRPSSTGPQDNNRRPDVDAPRYNPCIEFLQHARPQVNSPSPG